MIEIKSVNGPNDKITVEMISKCSSWMDEWSKRLLNGQMDYYIVKCIMIWSNGLLSIVYVIIFILCLLLGRPVDHSTLSMDAVIWSDEVYTVDQLVHAYGAKLPVIAKVMRGCHDNAGFSLTVDQVIINYNISQWNLSCDKKPQMPWPEVIQFPRMP